jgi:hypothetical protein
VKRELERIQIPGEHDARERTWNLVAAAFAKREPAEHSARMLRPAIVAAVVVAALAAVLSPPGRAVVDEIRARVGVERAQPALFSLPTPGRMLVASDAGVWVVQADGSKRLLGPYREASWSPFGRFVVAARANELAALEPDGVVRWTLSRRGVRSPRWTGTDTDTRIAYVDRTGVRVVAGDGTGDRLLVADVQGPVAWRPGAGFVLTYATKRDVRTIDTSSGRMLWRSERAPGPLRALEWSSDGQRLLALSPRHLRVYDAHGRLVEQEDPSEGRPDVASTFRPRAHALAVARVQGAQSTAYLLNARTIFTGTGVFDGLAWSPDGSWLQVGWPSAGQWLFVRTSRTRRIRAVSNVSDQFRSQTFPRVLDWCCPP